jgi:hypothetical protein
MSTTPSEPTPQPRPSSSLLTGRSHTMVVAGLAMIAAMGLSPFFDVIALRWPLRFDSAPWRYQTYSIVLGNSPQFVVLLGLIAILAVVSGNRAALRAVSVVLGVVAILQLPIVLMFILDYFQTRRLVSQAMAPGFKAVAVKTVGFSAIVIASAGWSAWRGWQASVREGAGQRRKQGEGLVVGQPKPPRPAS